jgi:hypothetical protein
LAVAAVERIFPTIAVLRLRSAKDGALLRSG